MTELKTGDQVIASNVTLLGSSNTLFSTINLPNPVTYLATWLGKAYLLDDRNRLYTTDLTNVKVVDPLPKKIEDKAAYLSKKGAVLLEGLVYWYDDEDNIGDWELKDKNGEEVNLDSYEVELVEDILWWAEKHNDTGLYEIKLPSLEVEVVGEAYMTEPELVIRRK